MFLPPAPALPTRHPTILSEMVLPEHAMPVEAVGTLEP